MYEEEFDNLKTKMLKYIMYKKRTETEVRQKFSNFDENLIDEVIEYLKEAGYINDLEYINRAVNEFININTLSIKEIKYKLISKGINSSFVEDYISSYFDQLLEYEKNCAKRIYTKKVNSMDLQEIKSYLIKRGYKEESIKAIQE